MSRFSTFVTSFAAEIKSILLCLSSSWVILEFNLHLFWSQRYSVQVLHCFSCVLALFEINKCEGIFTVMAFFCHTTHDLSVFCKVSSKVFFNLLWILSNNFKFTPDSRLVTKILLGLDSSLGEFDLYRDCDRPLPSFRLRELDLEELINKLNNVANYIQNILIFGT